MNPIRKNRIGKLALLGLATGILATSNQSVRAQGKAEAAKAALEAAIDLGPKLHKLITGYDRSGTITIRNHTGLKLSNIQTYADSGKVVGLDHGRQINAKSSGGVAVKKSDGAARGAVGVITYKIEGTRQRLAIMYSIPYDYNLYSNWYKFAVISEGTPTNKALFNDMYDDDGKLTAGKVKKAGSENTWRGNDSATAAGVLGVGTPRWQMTGTMEDSGQTKIVLDFYDLGK